MSRFDTSFAACGLPGLMYQFGQSATLHLVDGPDVAVTAIKSPEVTRTEGSGGVTQDVRECDCTISVDPDSDWGGVVLPERISSVTTGGEKWPVTRVKNTTDGSATLSLQIVEVAEVGRDGIRGPG